MESFLNVQNIKLDTTNTKMNNNEFPQGTIYEKELIENFKYFNIFWFDPNKSHDFDHFIKYFENVQIYKGFDIETVLNFFKKESSIEEWIVITPGTKGEELVSKLHENKSIKAFCVFCFNPQFHQEWVKKYEKIKCLTNDPITLTEKFIELNKEYLIPNFNYDEKINKKKIDFDLNFNPKDLKPNNKFSLNSVLREFSDLNKSFNKNQNKYNIFCMKTLHYLKKENCFDDFIKTIKNENVPFYKYVENIKIEETERIKKIIKFVENITLISLYFSKYPYLLNLFSSQEIKNLLIEDITPKNYMKLYNDEVYEISEKFCEKINKNESILNDKEDLKKIQIFCILFTYFGLARYRKKEFLDYHQITNFYRDIDFCLKFLIFYIYLIFDDKKNKFMSDLNSSLNVCDFRVTFFMVYANSKLKNFKNTLNEEDQRIVDESLNIKDFLVIGDINFRNNVKAIENKIFKTPVGWEYLHGLRNKLLESGYTEEELIPIPLNVSMTRHSAMENLTVAQRIRVEKPKANLEFKRVFPIVLDVILYRKKRTGYILIRFLKPKTQVIMICAINGLASM